MRAASRPCPMPGCPNLTTSPKGCHVHRAQAAARTLYDAAWEAFARVYLAGHPTCERCRLRPAREVHHLKAARLYPGRRLDPTNVTALCWACHRAVTPTVRADAGRTTRRTR